MWSVSAVSGFQPMRERRIGGAGIPPPDQVQGRLCEFLTIDLTDEADALLKDVSQHSLG
jgi:hypothetical protein